MGHRPCGLQCSAHNAPPGLRPRKGNARANVQYPNNLQPRIHIQWVLKNALREPCRDPRLMAHAERDDGTHTHIVQGMPQRI